MTYRSQYTQWEPSTAENLDYERHVVELRNASLAERAHVGTKSATLGELMRAGFDVPDGFVLTTKAFQSFTHGSNEIPEAAASEFAQRPVPPGVVSALRSAIVGLGDGPVAVRSSAAEEDLDNASFAGIYETVLDVRGLEAVVQAVQGCWKSTLGERAVVYRAAKGLTGASRMAVLVQRMVAAEVSGVAFTADPLTGDTSVTLINAANGLGDAVVSGRKAPDEWRVAEDRVMCEESFEAVLDEAAVRRIAKLARRIEKRLGCPQDIEWALSEGRLYLLQSRPITSL